MPIRADIPNPPRPFPLKQSSILSACAYHPASLPSDLTKSDPASVSVEELRCATLHLAVPNMLAAGIVELDGLRGRTARRDLLGVHMPPALGDIAQCLIAPRREAAGGDHHTNEQKGHEPDRPIFTSVTHDTGPRQHATPSPPYSPR